MKTQIYKGAIITMLSVYLCIIFYGFITSSDNLVPKSKDSQIITVTQLELKQDDEWIPLILPGYIDIAQKETLRCKLNYTFVNGTTPSLMMQANHSFMDVLLDGKSLYRVEPQTRSLGNYITSIPLPAHLSEGSLEINISVPKNGLHRIQIPELYIADEAIYLTKLLKTDIASIALNSLLSLGGLIMLIIAFFNRRGANFQKMLVQGSITLNLAIYFMCEIYSIVFLFSNSQIIYYLDMLSFSMISSLFMLLFSWNLDKKYKKLLHAVAWLGIANTSLQLVLSLMGIIELRAVLQYTHLHQIISTAAIIFCLIDSIWRHRKVKTILFLFLIIIGGLIDMLLFLTETNKSHNVFFLKIGVLVYILQQLYEYIRKFIEHIKISTRENYYKHLAFEDILTGCNSRLAYEIDKCEYHTSDIRTVFSFDLNDLKQTNDVYGHMAGDNLLQAFGTLLTQVFAAYGKCYRIGGDEFVVFCDNLPEHCDKELLLQLDGDIACLNDTHNQKLPISYAVGVFSTKETAGDFERAIFLSDEQMYENKRQMKTRKNVSEN